MKILILIKSIDGGTGTFVQQILEINKFYKINKPILHILALEEPTYRMFDYKVSFIHGRCHYPQKYNLCLSSILSFIKEYFVVANTIKNFQPNVILSVDLHCNILALTNKWLSHGTTKMIISTHIYLSETIYKKASTALRIVLEKLINFLYNRADFLIAISNGIKKDLIQYFHIKKKINVIFNGIDVVNIKKNHSKNNKNRILTVGRLDPQKDFITLIRAFSCLVRDIPDARLTIVGDGTQKDVLIKLVHDLKLQKQVIFRGWQNGHKFYSNGADIFVLSSLREGFPYVLLEAMSAGLPVISSDALYGPKEILLDNVYGRIVPVMDVKELTVTMKMLLLDKKKYVHYANKALERAGHFSLKKMLLQYKKIFDKFDDGLQKD